jgi:hypothetical protein
VPLRVVNALNVRQDQHMVNAFYSISPRHAPHRVLLLRIKGYDGIIPIWFAPRTVTIKPRVNLFSIFIPPITVIYQHEIRASGIPIIETGPFTLIDRIIK